MDQGLYYYRRLNEFELPMNFNDPYNIYKEANIKRKVLLSNPFKNSDKDIFQILGVVDNNIVGTEVHLPIQLLIDNRVYYSLTGHGLYVHPDYRGMGLGSILTNMRLDYSLTHSLLLCNASQMQLPILKRLGACIFYMPRLILLKRSFPVLEQKVNKIFAKLFSPIIDNLLKIQWKYVFFQRKRILEKGFTIKKCVGDIPQEIEAIINSDLHRFKEKHTKEWFDWIMTNSLDKNSKLKKTLFMVHNKGELIGFYVVKEKFYIQASHRGFKNVNLGSVIEWGSKDERRLSNNDLCLLAITSFGNSVDAVELCCDSEKMSSFFKRKGMIQVGSGNVVLRFKSDSVLSKIDNIHNSDEWRLRPAMGDNSLS